MLYTGRKRQLFFLKEDIRKGKPPAKPASLIPLPCRRC
jgi:hypothetical protein